MQYQINKTNYHTFDIFEVNKMPPRSYFIPYPDRKAADQVTTRERRYASPMVQCLNGDWDFKFYHNPADLPDVLDTDAVDWDTIDVPVWDPAGRSPRTSIISWACTASWCRWKIPPKSISSPSWEWPAAWICM